VPQVVDGPTGSPEPIHRAAALKALMTTTIFMLRGYPGQAIDKVSRAVRKLPCYRLAVGADLAMVAERIAALVDRHAV
jgi:hypothetical protein